VDNFEATKCQRRQLYIQGFSNLQSYRKHPDGAGDLSTKNQKQRWKPDQGPFGRTLWTTAGRPCQPLLQQGKPRPVPAPQRVFETLPWPRPAGQKLGVAIERRNTPARPWTAP